MKKSPDCLVRSIHRRQYEPIGAQERGIQYLVGGLLTWYYSRVVENESPTLASGAFTITLADANGELTTPF